MRKWKGLLLAVLALLSMLSCALAQDALPQGVLSLCAQAYPGYAIAAQDGWGDETQGQYALVLSKDGDNLLCIAEKGAGDGAYALTVNNRNAVRPGEEIPFLLIDTGGDSLFYSYLDAPAGIKTGYHSLKQNGVWGAVSLEYMDTSKSEFDQITWTGAQDGRLRWDVSAWTKNENPVDYGMPEYMDVPISAAYQQALALATFDLGMLSATPHCLEGIWPGLCDGLYDAGDELLEVDIKASCIVMLVEKPDGSRRIRIARDGAGDAVEESLPLPDTAWMDTFHSDGDNLILNLYGDDSVSFEMRPDGRFFLHTIQDASVFTCGYDYVDIGSLPYRNDGCVYGEAPWAQLDLMTLDLCALPRVSWDARAMLDESAYRFVCNPDPADRLHLREAPDRGARSLGKFYNRTPVRVLEERGDWVRVRIGSEAQGLEGWMMAQYLSEGIVECAFPQMLKASDAVALYVRPDNYAQKMGEIRARDTHYIIGVYGQDWYIVMDAYGMVGYARVSAFWEGNG